MTARDLDLVVGAGAIGLAGILSRIAEPAVAITMLVVAFVTAALWLGDEGIATLWRAYCEEPAPRRARKAPLPRPSHKCLPPPRPDRAPVRLPRAQVVSTR